MLRCTKPQGSLVQIITQISGLDLERFRAAVWHRIEPAGEPPGGELPSLGLEAKAALDAAIARATEKRHGEVREWHLLSELAASDDGVVAQ